MADPQTEAFAESEGDRYFDRNRRAEFHLGLDGAEAVLKLRAMQTNGE